MSRSITVFINSLDGIQSEVRIVRYGYSVILRDTDANKIVQVVKIFRLESAATKYAKSLVSMKLPRGFSVEV